MYPGMNMQISIQRQVERIRKKMAKDIARLEKGMGDAKALLDTLLDMAKDECGEEGQYSLLIPYYVLQEDFRMAWIVKKYLVAVSQPKMQSKCWRYSDLHWHVFS